MSIDVAEWIDAQVERSVRADRVHEQRRDERRRVAEWVSLAGRSLTPLAAAPAARRTRRDR